MSHYVHVRCTRFGVAYTCTGAVLYTPPGFVGMAHRKLLAQGLTGSSGVAVGGSVAAAVEGGVRHMAAAAAVGTAKKKKKRQKLAEGLVPKIPSFMSLRYALCFETCSPQTVRPKISMVGLFVGFGEYAWKDEENLPKETATL